MTLTLVGADGNQTTINESDIAGFSTYRAFGGYKNQLGLLKGLGNYTGVPISTYCGMVGEVKSGYTVHIKAIDGYTKTITYEEVTGDFITYDNQTGQEVQHNQTLTPILAYHYNDANLSSSDGPLKVAIVGPEGLCTGSTYWVKQVTALEILDNLQPMNLTVVALNGAETRLNETGMSLLSALRGVGARRNQIGAISGLGNYTGPTLTTLLNSAGGMTSNNVLRVTSADSYAMILSYEQVSGAVQAYDNVTGQPVQNNQSLALILAYHFNDANLSLSDGPLRLAIIGPEGLATSSSYWSKQVVKLEIRYRTDVALTAGCPLKTVVGRTYLCDANVTASNQGGYTATFNVTAYANEVMIGKQNITLDAGSSADLTFVWNTTGFALGNYTLRFVADTVPEELETVDNAFNCSIPVRIGGRGDVTGPEIGVPDNVCDMRDIGYVASKFGTNPSSPNWNPNCDVTGPIQYRGDNKVDMRDIGDVCSHFREPIQ